MENPTKSAETSKNSDDKRLWIGNLDCRVTEYHLLKLVQKHGAIEKFDLLFHRAGPLAGQPRGYAFVTFNRTEDAIRAKDLLHGTVVGQKRIMVTWAHSMPNEEITEKKPEVKIPALAISKSETQKTDKELQIQAIEAKLRMMERKNEDELRINETVANKTPIISQYQHNRDSCSSTSGSSSFRTRNYVRKYDRFSRDNRKPYSRHKR